MALDVRPPEWGGPRPYPRRGPTPWLRNADSGGSESSGTTELRSADTYYESMNSAVGETNYFAKPGEGGSGSGGSGSGQETGGDPDPNAPWWEKLWHWLTTDIRLDEGEPDDPADSYMDTWFFNTGLGKKANDFIEANIYNNWRNKINADMVKHPNTWALAGGFNAAASAFYVAAAIAGAAAFGPAIATTGAGLLTSAANSAAVRIGGAATAVTTWITNQARYGWNWSLDRILPLKAQWPTEAGNLGHIFDVKKPWGHFPYDSPAARNLIERGVQRVNYISSPAPGVKFYRGMVDGMQIWVKVSATGVVSDAGRNIVPIPLVYMRNE